MPLLIRFFCLAALLPLAACIHTTPTPRPQTALQLLTTRRPLVIAHRGFPVAAPENTLPSFELAVLAGADLVELDYQLSRDGVPVVMHDLTLDRTTDAQTRWGRQHLRLADHTAAELQTLDAGAWFKPRFKGTPPPLLDEALAVIQRGAVTLIERKAGDAASFAAFLTKRRLTEAVAVQSYDWKYLHELHTLLPELVLGALGPHWGDDGRTLTAEERILGPRQLDEIAAVGARVAVWSRDLNRESVIAAHARDLKVWVYTVDDPAVARELFALGIDGIITNQTARMWKTLATRTEPNVAQHP